MNRDRLSYLGRGICFTIVSIGLGAVAVLAFQAGITAKTSVAVDICFVVFVSGTFLFAIVGFLFLGWWPDG